VTLCAEMKKCADVLLYKTYPICDHKSMNKELFDQTMKCKFCRTVDTLRLNKRVALFIFKLTAEKYLNV